MESCFFVRNFQTQSAVCTGTLLWWRNQLSFCQSFTCFFHTSSCKWCHTDDLVHCLTSTNEFIVHLNFNSWSQQAWPSHSVSFAVLFPVLGRFWLLLWRILVLCFDSVSQTHSSSPIIINFLMFSSASGWCKTSVQNIQSLLCSSASCSLPQISHELLNLRLHAKKSETNHLKSGTAFQTYNIFILFHKLQTLSFFIFI